MPKCYEYKKEGEPTWYSVVMVHKKSLEVEEVCKVDKTGMFEKPLKVNTYANDSSVFRLQCRNCEQLVGDNFKLFSEAKSVVNKWNRGS